MTALQILILSVVAFLVIVCAIAVWNDVKNFSVEEDDDDCWR